MQLVQYKAVHKWVNNKKYFWNVKYHLFYATTKHCKSECDYDQQSALISEKGLCSCGRNQMKTSLQKTVAALISCWIIFSQPCPLFPCAGTSHPLWDVKETWPPTKTSFRKPPKIPYSFSLLRSYKHKAFPSYKAEAKVWISVIFKSFRNSSP